MGCTASRAANEDAVRRCRDRRRLMKEAVLARHHLAAAHSDYLRSLRLAASALSRFASFHSLPVFAAHPPPPAASARAHLASASSRSSSTATAPTLASTYAASPSQASSAWDWERFYPPSPPGSEFFDEQRRRDHHLPREEEGSDDEAAESVSGGASEADRARPSFVSAARVVGEGAAEVVVQHRDLAEIAAAVEEWFGRAADAGEGMRELLENGREQLDRSFRQLKKTVYHSNSVVSTLASKWTSKPPLAVRYQLDTAALDDSGGQASHCSTLERLLAWEKKLYQEVKAREEVKIQHEKKLATLQSQECRDKDLETLDKTKAAIQKLQSLILVTSQAVSTTSSAIVEVRDGELAPQLVRVCHGFLTMWKSMHQCHEVQNQIVQQVRGLGNNPSALQSTSDLHRQATHNLVSAVEDWHSSFTRIVKFNREYVRSLCAWLKLTRVDDAGEKDNSASSLVSSELSAFCENWKQALDRLPDIVASEAISGLSNVIHSISLKQTEEVKIKKRVDGYSRELEKRSSALRSIERKYYQSYSIVGLKLPDNHPDNQLLDARDPLREKKSEIEAMRRKVSDEMAKHMKAIVVTRDMTLNSIQTGLPGVFQAITAFSGVFAESLEEVCSQKGDRK